MLHSFSVPFPKWFRANEKKTQSKIYQNRKRIVKKEHIWRENWTIIDVNINLYCIYAQIYQILVVWTMFFWSFHSISNVESSMYDYYPISSNFNQTRSIRERTIHFLSHLPSIIFLLLRCFWKLFIESPPNMICVCIPHAQWKKKKKRKATKKRRENIDEKPPRNWPQMKTIVSILIRF